MAGEPEGHQGPRPPGRSPRTQGIAARFEVGFERLLELSRIVVLAPVVVLVLSGIGAFAYGTDVFVASIPSVIEDPLPVGSKVGYFLVEIDLFLVGATMIIAAFGFYELFISKIDARERGGTLPRWLEMRDLNDLKARVISMLILLAAVTFVDVVLELKHGLDILYLGAAVALVIGALTVYLRFGGSADHGRES